MSKYNILVSCSAPTRDAIQHSLENAGFAFSLICTDQRQLFVDALTSRDQRPDIIISELELDDFSARELKPLLKQYNSESLPVILVTETGAEPFALACLEEGIDQFVINTPASLHRLCVLIPFVIRQAEKRKQQQLLAEEIRVSRERYLDIFDNASDLIQCLASEEARKVSDARYQTLYDNAPDIYSIVNTQGEFESINRTGAKILGYEVDELVGQPATRVIHPEDRERVLAYITERFADPVESNGIEYRKVRKDGSVIWIHQRVSLDPDTSQPRMLILCRDITEQHELRKQLSYQATHDELTQLINRREFDSRLRRMLAAPGNPGDDHHVLCYLDLDQFKVINDTCGHSAGDELLRQIATLLSRQIRSRDTLARLGGDEFAILMEHCPLEQAEVLANRIREKIEDFRFQWKTQRFSIGASIGVVPIQHSGSVEDVLSLADSACYEAKQLGRNRVHVFHPGDQAIIGKVGDGCWASRITEALDTDAFSLFAQEIAPCSGDRNGKRMEILIRLRDADVMINPGAFMPVAERYNLSAKLDQWVLNQTLSWFEQRPEALAELEMCSVNLSALSLCDDTFRHYALERIDHSDFPTGKLCFEVTETAAISNVSKATQFMKALRDKGCLFALDDFGSGLSSLAYLKDLPVDIVKIDGAFVRNIASSDVDRMMVKSICEIARMMNMKTTAEYVESEEALQILRETGVDYVQGFHIGHPIPIEEFTENRRHKAEILRFRR